MASKCGNVYVTYEDNPTCVIEWALYEDITGYYLVQESTDENGQDLCSTMYTSIYLCDIVDHIIDTGVYTFAMCVRP